MDLSMTDLAQTDAHKFTMSLGEMMEDIGKALDALDQIIELPRSEDLEKIRQSYVDAIAILEAQVAAGELEPTADAVVERLAELIEGNHLEEPWQFPRLPLNQAVHLMNVISGYEDLDETRACWSSEQYDDSA